MGIVAQFFILYFLFAGDQAHRASGGFPYMCMGVFQNLLRQIKRVMLACASLLWRVEIVARLFVFGFMLQVEQAHRLLESFPKTDIGVFRTLLREA